MLADKANKQETTQKGTKPTPVPAKKDRPKGSWADTWEMTPSQQREFMESKAEREEERRKRLLYRVRPLITISSHPSRKIN
jgi:hypothetical protein